MTQQNEAIDYVTGGMKAVYQLRGWLLIRPIRWFFHNIASASFGARWLPEKNPHHPYFGPRYRMPNIHWYFLYRTIGKFFLWLDWDAWRVFCDWTGGFRRSYPWPARLVHSIGKTTAGYAFHGGQCFHCASEEGDPVDLCNDTTGKFFQLTDSGTNATQDGTDHWFRGITTCPKCGYKQEYGDSSL